MVFLELSEVRRLEVGYTHQERGFVFDVARELPAFWDLLPEAAPGLKVLEIPYPRDRDRTLRLMCLTLQNHFMVVDFRF